MLQELSKKTKGLVKALPLLFGLGLTSPAVSEAKNGSYVGAGAEVQLFEEGILQEVYGRGFGVYGEGGGRYSVLDGGIRVGYIFKKGDTEKLRSLFGGEEVNENLGMFYFGPYGRISLGPIFFNTGYEFYDLSNQTEKITERLFEEKHITRTDRDYLKGFLVGGGFSIPFKIEDPNYQTLDGLVNIGINYRTAEIIRGPSLQASVKINF